MQKTKKSAKKLTAVDIVCIGLSAAIIAVCSQIAIPFAVPFTLQTFAVCTTAGLFGAKRGTISVLIYILLGAAGVPVFSGFRGGISALLGVTGGYIIGFIFTALIIGTVSDKFNRKPLPLVISMIFGLAVCYIFGTIWFMSMYAKNTGTIGISAVLSMCVIPFIIPDIIKIACAAFLCGRVGKHLKLQ